MAVVAKIRKCIKRGGWAPQSPACLRQLQDGHILSSPSRGKWHERAEPYMEGWAWLSWEPEALLGGA